jgi:hypothetical protein
MSVRIASKSEAQLNPARIGLETLHAELLTCATAYLRWRDPSALDAALSSTEVFDRAIALGWRDDREWFDWTPEGVAIVRIPEWARKLN